jgi:L-arabinose isomerase
LFYLKLYDEVMPELRNEFKPLILRIAENLRNRDIEVNVSRICRIESEFDEAVAEFESKNVDVIVTLHLAYSPSLESSKSLKSTKIPIVVFDTTLKNDFSSDTTGDDIMENHGIHGVQDMCNILLRNGKHFLLTAGYHEDEKTLEDLCINIRAARLFRKFSTARVGSLGGPFVGMGDFFVEPDVLQDSLGIKVLETDFTDVAKLMPESGSRTLLEEMDLDKNHFNIAFDDDKAHSDSNRVGLAVRKWMEINNLDAFTMNFSNLGPGSGFPTIPFLESSKVMASGKGYAGEGDTLTSAFVGALLSVFKDTTFTEMFCPDWQKNMVFLSHMGEVNVNLLAGKPTLIKKELSFIKVSAPVFAVGQLKGGKALLINLAPSIDGYRIVLSSIDMVEIKNTLPLSLSGWFRPNSTVSKFLGRYSELGGTHHCALVYGNDSDQKAIEKFAHLAGMETIVL